MRKTTISLITGIILGIIIANISRQTSVPVTSDIKKSVAGPPLTLDVNTVAITQPGSNIAPGLQIVEVPPPLDLNGLHPYQCYINGEPVNIPKELVKALVAKHGNPSEVDPNFNVHNFTGNLKMVGVHTSGIAGE